MGRMDELELARKSTRFETVNARKQRGALIDKLYLHKLAINSLSPNSSLSILHNYNYGTKTCVLSSQDDPPAKILTEKKTNTKIGRLDLQLAYKRVSMRYGCQIKCTHAKRSSISRDQVDGRILFVSGSSEGLIAYRSELIQPKEQLRTEDFTPLLSTFRHGFIN